MSPRALAGTEATAASRHLLPRTTVVAPAPPAPGALPLLRCPECGHTEPYLGHGNRTGELVRLAPWHFTDERGYYYCPACFVCWNALPVHVPADTSDMAGMSPTATGTDSPYARLGAAPSWIPQDGKGKFRALYEVQQEVNASYAIHAKGHEALRRAGNRVRDTEVVADYLGLPPIVRMAAAHHIIVASGRVTWRSLANNTREEAFTLATVALVAERFRTPIEEQRLLESIRFTNGTTVTAQEYARALRALRTWYEQNVWRDSKEE